MAPPSRSLERYDLLERIAVGGMAEVFRAKAYGAHGFEKTLAIKRILPELASDPEFEQRFIGEAKLAVQLTHANVVQVFDFGRFGGTLFIAMEYVDGLDLAEFLKRFRKLDRRVPIPAAFQIAVEIARGLDFAHQHGVVHRDVSPSNILLSRAGEVKIADFGIAQAVATNVEVEGGRRRIMGKWRYMSPEQTRGKRLTTKSDLFSAASVMFELFTGDKLFPGDEADQIIENIHTMEIPKASERRPGLPPRLDEVLGKALNRSPDKRPVKAAEMLRALIEVSYESSIVATTLDIAEAVAEVVDAPEEEERLRRAGGIDDLIQAQLGGLEEPRPPTQRRTAIGDADDHIDDEEPNPSIDPFALTKTRTAEGTQTAGTMVRKGVDDDGVTIWELDKATIAAGPAALRSSGPRAVIRDDRSGPKNAGEVDTDGAPAASTTAKIGVAAATMVALGFAGFLLVSSGGSKKAPVVSAPSTVVDNNVTVMPPPEPTMGLLGIQSNPPGATILIDAQPIAEVTPTHVELEPDIAHDIVVKLDGFRRHTDQVTLSKGQELTIRPQLIAIQASLRVRTTPDGANVVLNGIELGTTPLDRNDLRPGSGLKLVITKPDYKKVTLSVELIEGTPLEIDQKLWSSLRYGEINLNIEDSWAYVYLNGKKVGQAPGTIRRLPVGKQTLLLKNPESKKRKTFTVIVTEGKKRTYTTRF